MMMPLTFSRSNSASASDRSPGAVGREVLHVEVADLRGGLARPGRHRQHARRRIDGGRPDEGARDGELLHARRGVALDLDVDVGVDVAAQALDRLVQVMFIVDSLLMRTM
jgi:hypothetical protein